MKTRLKRLAKMSQLPTSISQEEWARQAATHLADEELLLLKNALRRGFDPRKEQQDVLASLGPLERAAYERFAKFYDEARCGA